LVLVGYIPARPATTQHTCSRCPHGPPPPLDEAPPARRCAPLWRSHTPLACGKSYPAPALPPAKTAKTAKECSQGALLQPIIAETKREGFAGRDIRVPSKSLPRTANLSREKSGPSERFLGSGRNLKPLPFGLRNYRLSVSGFGRTTHVRMAAKNTPTNMAALNV